MNPALLVILQQALKSKRVQAYIVSVLVTVFSNRFGITLDPEMIAGILAALTGALIVSDGMRGVVPHPVLIKEETVDGVKVAAFDAKTGERIN